MKKKKLKFGHTTWAILLLAVTLKILIQGDQHTVFPIFKRAAENWWQNKPLYTVYQDIDLYRYSPTFAIFFSLFSFVPFQVGSFLWSSLNLISLFIATQLLCKNFLPSQWSQQQRQAVLAFTALGAIRMLWNSQSNPLLLSLSLFSILAVYKQQWWTSALLLAGAVYIKLWPLLVAIILVINWPRKLFFRFSSTLLTFGLTPFAFGPPSYVLSQYDFWLQSTLTTRVLRWPSYRDAWTIWETLFSSVNPNIYLAIQLLTGFFLLLACQQFNRHFKNQALLLLCTTSTWASWQLLFGPGSERATYGIIAPFFAIAVVHNHLSFQNLIIPIGFVFYLCCSLGDLERSLSYLLPFASALLPLSVGSLLYWNWKIQKDKTMESQQLVKLTNYQLTH